MYTSQFNTKNGSFASPAGSSPLTHVSETNIAIEFEFLNDLALLMRISNCRIAVTEDVNDGFHARFNNKVANEAFQEVEGKFVKEHQLSEFFGLCF